MRTELEKLIEIVILHENTNSFETRRLLNIAIEKAKLALQQPLVSGQVSCNTCKFLEPKYDHYCNKCIKFEKYEPQETFR